ncbi:ISAon1 family transposase N-terminal region protein [Pedobacter suwonensis]|uniref:ISAon1 family transposase N-terminal region protein n=1 Tax=Pedobacter suwonensis TaxID=332999 RepID=UPI0036C4D319
MNQAEQTLISFLLPPGILDYFEILKVEKELKELQIYLEEKNIAPSGYQIMDLESKGFLPEVAIQDFLLPADQGGMVSGERNYITLKCTVYGCNG